MEQSFLEKKNREYFLNLLNKTAKQIVDWKTDNSFVKKKISENWDNSDIPMEGMNLEMLLKEYLRNITYNTNFSSKNFMGFPDAGNTIAPLFAGIIEVFLQQNMINNSICAPYATKIELETISWMRQLLGFKNTENFQDISDIGGAVTTGGVMSNTYVSSV